MTGPRTLRSAGMQAVLAAMPQPDSAARAAAAAREAVLTKPPGALGRLEDIAIWHAGWRGTAATGAERPQILVFAGNHGVAARGVSAFPAEVTEQMVANFTAGGAAINQLARLAGARLDIRALNLESPTADFTVAPAMSVAEFDAALDCGWQGVDARADLLVPGEMGIANTTSAAAIAAALFGGDPADWVGAGTGVDAAGRLRKAETVALGLARHASALDDPCEVLRRLGGREIAAMAGAILRARHLRIPVLLDGFVSTAAAAVLWRLDPGALAHCRAGHRSAEAGHGRLLDCLGLRPLLDLDMRLGEASGGAVAIALVRAALACHGGMASFAEAGVSRT